MVIRTDAERFARAIALYHVGKVNQATALFRAVATGGGTFATKARRYSEHIVATTDAELFARAIALYHAGKVNQAIALFRAVATGGGTFATKARRYLEHIAATADRGDMARLTVRSRSKKQAEAILGGLVGNIVKHLKKGERIRIGGLGSLQVRKRAARMGRNPATGEPIQIKANKKVAFRASKELKEALQVRPGGRPTPEGKLPKKRRTYKPKPAEGVQPDSASTTILTRTPHMDIKADTPVQPGSALDIKVFVDQQAAREGEESKDIAAPAGTRLLVELFVSEHFSINGLASQPMTMEDTPRSDAPPFRVTVKGFDQLPADRSPYISAVFFHEGRPCGMVRRTVEIAGVVRQLPTSQRIKASRIEVVPAAKKADLNVTIVAGTKNDGQTYTCIVQSRHLAAYRKPKRGPWPLPSVTKDLVRGYMKEFTDKNASAAARIASLRGAGEKLFDVAPKIFHEAFWKMIDEKKPLKDIAIVSEEVFIPWELMIPNRRARDGARKSREPLGLEFRIGRWTNPDMIKPRQRLNLMNSYVIAPNYTDVRKQLKYAQDEAAFVVREFNGEQITPADFADIEEKLKTKGRTLVHFVCHGVDSPDGAQIIDLENNERLTTTSLEGMKGIDETFYAIKPIIFLNACEVGRPAPALVGLGGFAATFIGLGASAVIAPLWSVKDSIAHEIAIEFYSRVKAEPGTPFAEILRSIRKKAYDSANGEDTYAAYSFYGDPAAIAVHT